jgi:hypothetical protein
LRIKPAILIISILIGYIAGIGIVFFDNHPTKASFAEAYPNFSKISNHNVTAENFKEPTTLSRPEDQLNAVWFFRRYPFFLVWSIMHIIGVALCFAMIVVAFFIQKYLRTVYKVKARKIILTHSLVFVTVIAVVVLIYHNGWGFDYVAHLIPMNHPKYKIYGMEILNYIAGGLNLGNMVLIAFVADEKRHTVTRDELSDLNKFFHASLFIAATIVAYATLTSGVLFKALNHFYFSLYDTIPKTDLYFPFTFITMLGFINTFLLSMFYFPCLLVFQNIQRSSRQHAIQPEKKEITHPKSVPIFLGLTKDMIETIQTILALLAPLITGLFS